MKRTLNQILENVDLSKSNILNFVSSTSCVAMGAPVLASVGFSLDTLYNCVKQPTQQVKKELLELGENITCNVFKSSTMFGSGYLLGEGIRYLS